MATAALTVVMLDINWFLMVNGNLICPDSAIESASAVDVERCKYKGGDQASCESKFGAPAIAAAKAARDGIRADVISGLRH